MHFKLDENVPTGLVDILKQRGFEATSVYGQRISGIKDRNLALHCKENKFILNNDCFM